MSSLVGNATLVCANGIDNLVKPNQEVLSKDIVLKCSALGRKWVQLAFENIPSNQLVPFEAKPPVCTLDELSLERLQYTLGRCYSQIGEKVNVIGEKIHHLFNWVCASSKSALDVAIENPSIVTPLKNIATSIVVISGTALLMKASDELFLAVEGEKPKEHLFSALKLTFLAGMSFYTGYSLNK